MSGAAPARPATPDALVHEYFRLAVLPDPEPWFALFAPDVQVTDDGREYAGIDEVRAWRSEVPNVTYEVLELEPSPSVAAARARVAGDFPGSPVDLRFDFGFDPAGKIQRLRIAP
ncbi:nuclear transport factor 2 family protein [Motilibacter deserti]|uniref:SnoaL-like domain-containing protein n=1 Tax=Motilibacter deserti TaxID=2714956 RepID=A0ABX0H3D8_9ACTN|nr:nuclear transport factor 2 family protein [Motilibacter deserti]NHC16304.1 SnoaL-like domain-containing protein [Motilibacter deserti]